MVKWRFMRTLSMIDWIYSDGDPVIYIYRSKKYFTSLSPFGEQHNNLDDHFLNWPEVTEPELQMFELS